jgi:hypothetical protein
LKAAPPAARKRWRLWHFAVVVLLAAPVFATVRAINQGPKGPTELIMVALVMATACGGASLVIVRAGRKVAGRATSRLKEWGIHRNGLVGLFVYLIGLGLEVGFALAAIVIGPVVTIALIAWLAGLIGR